jgi:hypothetical protein
MLPVIRVLRAGLAIHPARISTGVVLLLPYRNAVFNLINDVATRSECFVAMTGADPYPNGKIADFEFANPVDTQRMLHREPLGGLGHYPVAFL